MIQVALAGATGRMGGTVMDCISRDSRFQIAAALTNAADPLCGSSLRVADRDVPVVDRLTDPCDVLIDFTLPDGTMSWLEVCADWGLPMVIGTTGHSDNQLAQIREATATISIVFSGNFSTGVNALLGLIGRLARELGDAFDVELVETHHREKIDVPSGTALLLTDEILKSTGRTRSEHLLVGRRSGAGRRRPGQIGVHSLRMGDIVGRHEIHFSGPGETITITHSAQSRETFAVGAIRAAAWVIGKPPALYSMRDVLG